MLAAYPMEAVYDQGPAGSPRSCAMWIIYWRTDGGRIADVRGKYLESNCH